MSASTPEPQLGISLSWKERLKLIDTLNRLPVSDFCMVEIALAVPQGVMPAPHAATGQRSAALIRWLEGSSGPGHLGTLLSVLAEMGISVFSKPSSTVESNGTPGYALNIKLEGEIDELNREKLDQLVFAFQELAQSYTVKVNRVRRGSIEVELRGLAASLNRIKTLVESNEVSHVSGLLVTRIGNVRPAEVPEGLDLRNANLSGADLSDADLSQVNFSQADLREVNLSRANLRNADLSRADLRRASFGGANLHGASLYSSKLQETNFDRADCSNVNLQETNLRKAELRNTVLDGANLTNATCVEVNMQGASFRSADLRGANFRGADLRASNFEGAILTGITLIDANLQSASFQKANLRRAIFQGAKLRETDFRGANLSDLEDLRLKQFARANVEQASFGGASGLSEYEKFRLTRRGGVVSPPPNYIKILIRFVRNAVGLITIGSLLVTLFNPSFIDFFIASFSVATIVSTLERFINGESSSDDDFA